MQAEGSVPVRARLQVRARLRMSGGGAWRKQRRASASVRRNGSIFATYMRIYVKTSVTLVHHDAPILPEELREGFTCSSIRVHGTRETQTKGELPIILGRLNHPTPPPPPLSHALRNRGGGGGWRTKGNKVISVLNLLSDNSQVFILFGGLVGLVVKVVRT